MEQEIQQMLQQKAVYDQKIKEFEGTHAQLCNEVMELSKSFESLKLKHGSLSGNPVENFKQSIVQKYKEIHPEYMNFKYNRFCSEVGEMPQKAQGKSDEAETIDEQLNVATTLLIQLNTELENLEKKRNQLLSDCEKHKNDIIAIKQDMEPLKIQAEKELRQSRHENLEILNKTNYINLDQINKRLQFLADQLQKKSETAKVETCINTTETTIGYQKVALDALNYVSALLRNDPNSITPEQIEEVKKYTEEMNNLYTFQTPEEYDQELDKSKNEMAKLINHRDEAIQKINKIVASLPILANHEKSLRDQVDDVKTNTDMIQYEQKQVTSRIKRVEYDIKNKDESLYQSYWDVTRKLTDKKYVLLINYSQNRMTDEKERRENDKRDKELLESKKKQAFFDELLADPKHNQDEVVSSFLSFIKTNDDAIEKKKNDLVVKYQPKERSDAKAFANLKAKETEERNKKQEKELKQKTELEKKKSKALAQLEGDFNIASSSYIGQLKDLPNPNSDVKALLESFTSKINAINSGINAKNKLTMTENPRLQIQFDFASQQLLNLSKDGNMKITNVGLIHDFLPHRQFTIDRTSLSGMDFYYIKQGNVSILFEAMFNKFNIDPLYPMALFSLSLIKASDYKLANTGSTYLLNSVRDLINEIFLRNEISSDLTRSNPIRNEFPYIFDTIFQYFPSETSVELVINSCLEFISLIAQYQLLSAAELELLKDLLTLIEEKSENEIKAVAHSIKGKLGLLEEQTKKTKRQTITQRSKAPKKVDKPLTRPLPKVVEIPSKIKSNNFIELGVEIYYNTITYLQYLQYLTLCTGDIFSSSTARFKEYNNYFNKTKEFVVCEISSSYEKSKEEKRRVFNFWYDIADKAYTKYNYFFFKAIVQALEHKKVKQTNDNFMKDNQDKKNNVLFTKQDIDPNEIKTRILNAKFNKQSPFLFIPDPKLFSNLRHLVKDVKHRISGNIIELAHFRDIAQNIIFLQFGQEVPNCEFQINMALQRHFKEYSPGSNTK